jgi:hypothetical protein
MTSRILFQTIYEQSNGSLRDGAGNLVEDDGSRQVAKINAGIL